jgi:hypothetical protein
VDSNDVNSSAGINRRDFMKVAGIGAAIMAMPGFVRNASAASISHVDQEVVTTDVLIIGGGIAATFAALKAKENGADVTLVDKGTIGRSGLSPFFGAFCYFEKGGALSREDYQKGVAETGTYINRPDYLDMYMDDSEAITEEIRSWGRVKNVSAVMDRPTGARSLKTISVSLNAPWSPNCSRKTARSLVPSASLSIRTKLLSSRLRRSFSPPVLGRSKPTAFPVAA